MFLPPGEVTKAVTKVNKLQNKPNAHARTSE